MMKGIYLGACRAYHSNYDLDYNDIVKTSEHINIIGDMLQVDISKYDYVIATPPCNYYSRANYRRETSEYSQLTKHLLPGILEKLARSGKIFIVENVRSPRLMEEMGVFKICEKYGIFSYVIGRHTYFTNLMCDIRCYQPYEFHSCYYAKRNGIKTENGSYREGVEFVHQVIEYWLQRVVANG